MDVHISGDVEAYAAAVTTFLEAEPCSRNVLHTVIEQVRAGGTTFTGPPSFCWVTDGPAVVGAAHWTPPFPLLVSSLPEAAAAGLVGAIRSCSDRIRLPVPGVNGPRAGARTVATAWNAATGDPTVEERRLLLHELTRVLKVAHPGGMMRPAIAADHAVLTSWLAAFADEVHMVLGRQPAFAAQAMLQRGTTSLWELEGRPVSLAGRNPPAAGVVRVGPVYTPPAARQRGYARRLVAEVSAASLALPGVTRCMLFTDAANPVSNSIYRQIGYVPGDEHVEIRFER